MMRNLKNSSQKALKCPEQVTYESNYILYFTPKQLNLGEIGRYYLFCLKGNLVATTHYPQIISSNHVTILLINSYLKALVQALLFWMTM